MRLLMEEDWFRLMGEDRIARIMANVFDREGIRSMDDLFALSDRDLKDFRNLGTSVLARIHQKLGHCAEWGAPREEKAARPKMQVKPKPKPKPKPKKAVGLKQPRTPKPEPVVRPKRPETPRQKQIRLRKEARQQRRRAAEERWAEYVRTSPSAHPSPSCDSKDSCSRVEDVSKTDTDSSGGLMPRHDTPLSPKMAALLILAVVADGERVPGNNSPTWNALVARKLAEHCWVKDPNTRTGKRLSWRLTPAGKALGAKLTVECAE